MTKRFALIFTFAISIAAGAVRGQSDARPVMGSCVVEWDSLQASTNEHGFFRRVFNSPTAALSNLECHVTTLIPGMASHPPHHHPEEEVIVIREGTVEALINGEWRRVGPGSVIFNACNVTHDFRNVGPNPALYHVVSWRSSLTPARTEHTDTIEDSKIARPEEGVMGPVAIDWNSVAIQTNATGLSREFFNSRTATAGRLEFHATTINPGASKHPPLAHPEDVVIVVREGDLEAYVNGEWRRAMPGSVVFSAANDKFSMRNVGKTPATYFVLELHMPAGSGF
jgi:quercetin dioxygenase-like cupin family protein